MITLLIVVIIFACVALLHQDGMWSNAVRLINVVTAALLAMNFFEPLANWLEQWKPEWTYLWDFLSLWGLFIVISLIFRVATDWVSPVKVQFSDLTNRIGSTFFSLWIGWIMVCLTMVSLHAAPLAKNSFRGSFQPEESMFFGFAPDRQWLAFTQKMSQGPYDCSVSEAEWKAEKTIFDPRGEFMPKYATRRANLENNVKKSNSLSASSGGS